MNDAEELEEVQDGRETIEKQEERPKENPKGETVRFLLLKINELQKKQSQIEEVIKDNQKFIKVHHEQLKRLNDNFQILLEQVK